MNNTNPLANLHDIHMPKAISMWPGTWGWYMLITLLAIMAIVAILYFIKSTRRRWACSRVLARLEKIKLMHEENPQQALSELSILLRRVALAVFPRTDVAHLQGEAWLKFLDKTGQTNAFTCGAAYVLADAPYKPRTRVDIHEILKIVQKWIRRNL